MTDPASAHTAVQAAHSIADWSAIVGFGLLFGAVGQGIRVAVGLKKLNDVAVASDGSKTVVGMIDPTRLLTSLMIGAIAGALTACTTLQDLGSVTWAVVAGLMTAGYTGTDIIEAFVQHYMPGSETPAPESPKPAAAAALDSAVG
jgi:hypothetical protein